MQRVKGLSLAASRLPRFVFREVETESQKATAGRSSTESIRKATGHTDNVTEKGSITQAICLNASNSSERKLRCASGIISLTGDKYSPSLLHHFIKHHRPPLAPKIGRTAQPPCSYMDNFAHWWWLSSIQLLLPLSIPQVRTRRTRTPRRRRRPKRRPRRSRPRRTVRR